MDEFNFCDLSNMVLHFCGSHIDMAPKVRISWQLTLGS